jgi:antiphage defense system Thoeris ThsB-like protein
MGLKAAITPGRNDMADLARTFVSFSSADKGRYDLMRAWKAHEHINFNFADFQLDEAINSQGLNYIKSVCAAKVRRADTFVLLIGNDTYTKTVFVKDEVEVAVEKGCKLIGANLNNCRSKDGLCPNFFADVGALFVPFSSRIVAEALTATREGNFPWYYFSDEVYTRLGYQLIGTTAILPPPPNPFLGGSRPPWAK